jgi:hypothetical protein
MIDQQCRPSRRNDSVVERMMNSWSKTCVDKEQNKCICVVDRYAWPSRPYGILEKETLKHKPTPGTAKYDTHTTLIDHTVTASYSCLLILSLDVGSSRRRRVRPLCSSSRSTHVRTYAHDNFPAHPPRAPPAGSLLHPLIFSSFRCSQPCIYYNTTRIYDSSLLLLVHS